MAEGSKIRLVRCPKCENVLPELPNYSVYQCGGCGALLRAKKKVAANVGSLEKPERERHGEDFDKFESLSEKEDGSYLDIASEFEKESGDGVFLDRRRDEVLKGKTTDSVRSSLLTIEGKVDTGNGIVKGAQRGIGRNDKYRLPTKHPIGNWVGRDDKENRYEAVNSSRGKGLQEILAQFKGSPGSSKSREIEGKWGLYRDGEQGPYGNLGIADDRSRFLTFAYPGDEGPSNYYSCHSSSSGVKNFGDPDGPNRFARVEQDRAELLRQLDELKEQICRSSPVADKQREGGPIDVKIAPPGAYYDHVTLNVPLKPLSPDKHVPRPPYLRQYGHDPLFRANVYMDTHNSYLPPKYVEKDFPVHADPIQLKMPMVNSHQSRGQYWQQLPHDYLLGKYSDFNQELLCSCFRCYNKNQHVPSQVPATGFRKTKFSEDLTDSNFNHHLDPIIFGSRKRNSQANSLALHQLDPKLHASWASNVDSDMNVSRQIRSRRAVAPHVNRRRCHPIAGGAPFITCYSCFELLEVPRKLKAKEKNQQKMRCGACSIEFLIEIKNKRLNISIPAPNKLILTEANDYSCEVSKVVLPSPDGGFGAEGKNFSVDFDNYDYDNQSTDFEGHRLPEGQRLNFKESEKRQGFTSISSASSEEEGNLDSMIVQRVISNFSEPPTKDNASSTFMSSPFAEHLNGISANLVVNRYGEGKKINITDQEKVILDKSTSKQNSVEHVSSETEVEVSFNEYQNTSLSQVSTEVSKEEERSLTNKGNESFLVGVLKKSFRDFSRSNHHIENERPKVFVNGQPIPDSIVKKAEKRAGPIHPGDYWYDCQAGFWGVMGQPCLGIIPPSIEEFNYPMPKSCAAGNTGVFVNGRELHQKDLDLLASRGLPTTKDKFYVIEVSGKVIDKDSGKQLNSLGKLAPTIQRLKRGFGMKVPNKLV